MPLEDLASIERRVIELQSRIGPSQSRISYAGPPGDATPHIEVDREYHYVVSERGTEYERRSTRDLDQLLEWIFGSITFSIATQYELHHRRPNQDFRRQLFAKQEELLATLSPTWAEHERKRHAAILKKHPFDDAIVAAARPKPSWFKRLFS